MRWSWRVGRVFAVVFGIIGLTYDRFFLLIALVVWLGTGEAAAMHLRKRTFDRPTGRANA